MRARQSNAAPWSASDTPYPEAPAPNEKWHPSPRALVAAAAHRRGPGWHTQESVADHRLAAKKRQPNAHSVAALPAVVRRKAAWARHSLPGARVSALGSFVGGHCSRVSSRRRWRSSAFCCVQPIGRLRSEKENGAYSKHPRTSVQEVSHPASAALFHAGRPPSAGLSVGKDTLKLQALAAWARRATAQAEGLHTRTSKAGRPSSSSATGLPLAAPITPIPALSGPDACAAANRSSSGRAGPELLELPAWRRGQPPTAGGLVSCVEVNGSGR